MSTVIWVNRLEDGKVTSHEIDRWALFKFADKIDRVCDEIGVTRMSEFHDTTDLEVNLGSDDDEENIEVDTYELMAERGKWFPPERGLEVIDRLLEHLEAKPVRFGLLGDRYSDVIRELTECRAVLEDIATGTGQFHLCIVM